jgi:hypothetical protein
MKPKPAQRKGWLASQQVQMLQIFTNRLLRAAAKVLREQVEIAVARDRADFFAVRSVKRDCQARAPAPQIQLLPAREKKDKLWLMKLRLDLLEHLSDEDILEEVLANNHRYKPEPILSKTGVGSLSSASTEERAQEEARSTARIQRAMQRLKQSGAKSKSKSDPSPKP